MSNNDKKLTAKVVLTPIGCKRSTARKRKSNEMEEDKNLNSFNSDADTDKSPCLAGLLTPRSTPSPIPKVNPDVQPAKKKRKKKESKASADESEELYEVEKIVGYHIDKDNEIYYLIKWAGWEDRHNTWEQIENLTACNKMLMEYFIAGGPRASQQEIDEMDKEIEESLNDVVIFQKLKDSDYLKMYLDEFSEECLDLSPLFKSKSIDMFVKETKRQYDYVVKTLIGMYNHRDYRMFRRGQHYKILLKICDLREAQLEQLQQVEAKINEVESCEITVENNVDLTHFPKDLEYITETKLGTGVIMPSDPIVGCDCEGTCSQKTKCCGVLSHSQFAYGTGKLQGKLRLPDHSAIYECNSKCKCDQKCPNRVVQHGRKIRLGIFKTENCGWGVKALEKIPRGTFVSEYVGELIKDAEAVVRDITYYRQGISYLFDLDFNEVEDDNLLHCIDATKYGNVARFINHSCDPNLSVFPVWIDCLDPNLPRLAFFSKRQINKNEEINFDYESVDGETEEETVDEEGQKKKIRVISKIKCHCNSAKCREWVFGNK